MILTEDEFEELQNMEFSQNDWLWFYTQAVETKLLEKLNPRVAELEAVLRECRRAFDYYDCSIEQWSVAEERKLRKEAIAKIDEVLHVKE